MLWIEQAFKVADNMEFSLTAGAVGYAGDFEGLFDPEQTQATLRLKSIANVEPRLLFRGRLLSPNGRPLGGGIVEVGSVRRGFRTSSPPIGMTSLTVTREDGSFDIVCVAGVSDFQLKVKSVGCCDASFTDLHPGKAPKDLRMTEGATIFGRVVSAGIPVSNLKISIVQKNLGIGLAQTPLVISTNTMGYFIADRLPSDRTYILAGIPGQAARHSIPAIETSAPKDGLAADLGDIQAERTIPLTFTFGTVDGSPLPRKIGFWLSQPGTWEGFKHELDTSKGRTIHVHGVNEEVFKISIRAQGYKVDSSEPFLQQDMNGQHCLRAEQPTTYKIFLKSAVPIPLPPKEAA
ncbi:MAG: hypothetical protein AAF664_03055 [Planctomycetota bacterium]